MKSIINSSREEGISKINQQSVVDFQDGVIQAALAILAMMAALVGVWGLLSLIGGVALGGGVMEMARGWLGSIGGM
jgi:hypothetical protein